MKKIVLLGTLFLSSLFFVSCSGENDEVDDVDNKSGVEAVDLGLPSGLKWASYNLGAKSPEEYGDYFAWGETKKKSSYDWDNYQGDIKWEDAANVIWGQKWRMPNSSEMQELVDNCSWSLRTVKGVQGYNVEGKNGKSIFLPFAGLYTYEGLEYVGEDGNYWTSTIDQTESKYRAIALDIFPHVYEVDVNGKPNGLSIRPVCR